MKENGEKLQKEMDDVGAKLKEQRPAKRERRPSIMEASAISPAEMERRMQTIKKCKEVKSEISTLEETEKELKMKIKMAESRTKKAKPAISKPLGDIPISGPTETETRADEAEEIMQNVKLLTLMNRRLKRLIHNYRTRWEEDKRLKKLKMRAVMVTLGSAKRAEKANQGPQYLTGTDLSQEHANGSGAVPKAFAQALNAFEKPSTQSESQRRGSALSFLQVHACPLAFVFCRAIAIFPLLTCSNRCNCYWANVIGPETAPGRWCSRIHGWNSIYGNK
jgi:hypothetical protein